MSARSLAAMIESYLEDDDSSSTGSAASAPSPAPAMADGDTRRQLRQLTQATDQLKADNASLSKDLANIKNNLQMSAILPLLLNQKLSVVSDSLNTLAPDEEIEFKQSDPLSALLPALLMGGLDSSNGNGGGSDSSNTMMLMVLALSGAL